MLAQQPRTLNTSQPSTPDFVMELAPNLLLSPDVLIGSGNGIAGFGVQGSGKTNVLARILEQSARFSVPFVVFDKEGDLLTAVEKFPRGVIATFNNCPTGRDVLGAGLQVVYDLSTWPMLDMAGQMIATLVNQLMIVADDLPFSQRVPCLVALDEAAFWLPQRRGDTFSPETYIALENAFHLVATKGRKRGLTPALFTQKMSELNKTVLAPGTYIFMRQTVDVDLRRYLEYLNTGDLTAKQFMSRIAALPAGKAVVKLPSGQQKVVQFHERESEHISQTPQVLAALNRYAHQPFNAGARFGSWLPASELVQPGEVADIEALKQPPRKPARRRRKPAGKPKTAPTYRERISALLQMDANLTSAQLAALIGCPQNTAQIYRKEFRERPARGSIQEDRIRALLAENPEYTFSQLAKRARCSHADAKRCVERIRSVSSASPATEQ